MYDLPPQPTGKRGRPATHGKRLSIQEDFVLSEEKIGEYYLAVRHVLTNLFGKRVVLAYVTAPEKTSKSKRLFFSTILPERLGMFCAWQEPAQIQQMNHSLLPFLPLFLYGFRWKIEVSYYEQKTFWSLCHYMVRSRTGIELLVNLINLAYCAMKILPYQDKEWGVYQSESVQEFRCALSKQIREELFYASFVKKLETSLKSTDFLNLLKRLILRQEYHL